MSRVTTTKKIGAVTLTISADHTPYSPATMYDKHGDPGHEAEGGTEDVSVFIGQADITDLIEYFDGLDEMALCIEDAVAAEEDHLAALREDRDDRE